MKLSQQIDYLGAEQNAILSLADKIEKLLDSTPKGDYSEHERTVMELRSLDHRLAGIVEHCHAQDRLVESTYYQELQKEERERIDAEHQRIIQAVTSFREELKCATADRMNAMILPGMDVVKLIRTHVPYEASVLTKLALAQPGKTVASTQNSAKTLHAHKKRQIAKPQLHR
jgi:hypothetical protein